MSPAKLFIFHPSPVMVETLERLLADEAPDIVYENVIVPDLLQRAGKAGITDELRLEVKNAIEAIPQEPLSVVLCSCSTYGACAEQMAEYTTNPIIRIDRPMAEQAIETGTRVGVAAALESTLAPTRELLESVGRAKEKNVQIEELLCSRAWDFKKDGDEEGYLREIVDYLDQAAKGFDVIVLAQGSMARAAERLKHLRIPILSSPRAGVKKAVQMCRDLAA